MKPKETVYFVQYRDNYGDVIVYPTFYRNKRNATVRANKLKDEGIESVWVNEATLV